jgi:hypothetical protein
MADPKRIQLGDLCRRLDVPYRHARYVLEEGILPEGVEPSPERGHHRQLTLAQAFWLGITLKLKQSGVRAPLAGQLTDLAIAALRSVCQNRNLDWRFAPHLGWLETDLQLFVDIADLLYLRVLADATSRGKGVKAFPWWSIGRQRRRPKAVDPVVIIRIDVSRLAQVLRAQEPGIDRDREV